MQFSVHRDNLLPIININQKAVSARSIMPILSCLHFETSNDSLVVTSTDLDFGIRCTLPVTTIINGSAAIPSKYVASLFAKLPAESIDIQCDISTNTTKFQYADSELVLNGFPADEYPIFPNLPDKPTMVIKKNIFKKMLKRTLFAVSNDEKRPIFTGVNINVIDNSILTMVATDIKKLAVCEEVIEPLEQDINIIVPGKALNELYRIIDDSEEEIKIYINENKIFFLFDNVCMMSRLIAGQYPNYKIVIPTQYKCEVKASVDDLLEAAERAYLLIDNRRNVFNISFQSQGLLIYFYTESGRIREGIKADFKGEQADVGFNVRFFIDLLRAIDTEDVIIKISGHDSPAVFEPVIDESYFSLLVPAVA